MSPSYNLDYHETKEGPIETNDIKNRKLFIPADTVRKEGVMEAIRNWFRREKKQEVTIVHLDRC